MGIRDTKVQHLVKSPRSQQGLIKQIGSVGSTNDENALSPITHTVKLSKQLADNTVHYTATIPLVATLRRNGVQFIEEHNARSGIASSLEHASYIGF
jgi:hypothetical protein